MLSDSFDRRVSQVRISLNSSNECNFKCEFCHKEGVERSDNKILTPKEIERISSILKKFGINKIKLTGGEPMLRTDIIEVIKGIEKSKPKEISMSTNGTNLDDMAPQLSKVGLNRVNISLHSLQSERFKRLSGVDHLNKTIKAIYSSIEAQLIPVKINVTLMNGINNDEVEDLIKFSQTIGGGKTNILQFIELIPNGSSEFLKYHCSLDSVEEYVKKRTAVLTERISHRRPKYELNNGVTVEIVRPMHNTRFCMGCNRLRITNDGKFKPCLLREDNHVDFLTPMRNGAKDEEIIRILKKSITLREPYFRKLKTDKQIPIKYLSKGNNF